MPPVSHRPEELALPSEQGRWFPGGIFEKFLARILAHPLRHLENAFSARQHKRRAQNNVKSCSNQLGETDGGAKVLFLGKPQAPGWLRGLPDCPASSPFLLLLALQPWLGCLLSSGSCPHAAEEDLGKAGVSDAGEGFFPVSRQSVNHRQSVNIDGCLQQGSREVCG